MLVGNCEYEKNKENKSDPFSVFALGCLMLFKKKNKFYANFNTVLRGNPMIYVTDKWLRT